jgi:putrescine aminotransferase
MIENDLPSKALENGKFIMDAMNEAWKKYPGIIKDVRGKGCLIGVEFENIPEDKKEKFGADFWSQPCEQYFSEQFRIQIMYSFNNPKVFRWLPPLTATKEDIEYAIDAFAKSVEYVYGLSKS